MVSRMSLEKDLEFCVDTIDDCMRTANRNTGKVRCVAIDMMINMQLSYKEISRQLYGVERYYDACEPLVIELNKKLLYEGY